MASIHQTNNLHLSQFEASDQPKWLADYNNDMEKIDEGVALKEDVAAALESKANKQKPVVDTITPTLPHGGTIQAWKNDFGEVSLLVSIFSNSQLAPSALITTLPACYWPRQGLNVAAGYNDPGDLSGVVHIEPNGEMRVWSGSGCKRLNFYVCYISK